MQVQQNLTTKNLETINFKSQIRLNQPKPILSTQVSFRYSFLVIFEIFYFLNKYTPTITALIDVEGLLIKKIQCHLDQGTKGFVDFSNLVK